MLPTSLWTLSDAQCFASDVPSGVEVECAHHLCGPSRSESSSDGVFQSPIQAEARVTKQG